MLGNAWPMAAEDFQLTPVAFHLLHARHARTLQANVKGAQAGK